MLNDESLYYVGVLSGTAWQAF